MTRKRHAVTEPTEQEPEESTELDGIEEPLALDEQPVIVSPEPSQEQPVAVPPEPMWVPVTVVTQAANGLWRLQWKDAVGRLHQSWSPTRLERSTLEHLVSLPPHGDDFEAVVCEIKIPVDELVATLHQMNVWEYHELTYPVLRDICAGLARREFIQLNQRVQALNA